MFVLCAAAQAVAPEGPRLAFTAMSALSRSGFTVRTLGLESMRPRVLVRGSRNGVVPKPLDGVAWSADGDWLAFTASKGNRRGIYRVRADGTGLRFIRGTNGGSNPVFSPDGSKIAFTKEHLGEGFFFGTTPWVAEVDGSRAHRLAEWRDEVEYIPSSFSPDGSALAVTRTRWGSNESKVLLIALDGSGGRRVLSRHGSEAAFSPDGSQVVFVRYSFSRRQKIKTTHRDLYVMSVDGTTVRPLTRTRWIAESHPSWNSSGQRVSFNAFRISKDPIEALFDNLLPFGNSIVQVNADGTCREKVFSTKSAALFGAAWQPGTEHEAGRIDC